MPEIPLKAKMGLQDKIADLERRIVALEKAEKSRVYTRTTITHKDVAPEMGNIWKSFDALFKKAFK